MGFWNWGRKSKQPRHELHELGVPHRCEDPRAQEVLRLWLVAGRPHVVLRPIDRNEPGEWAYRLVTVLRHVAHAFESQQDEPGAETLRVLRGNFEEHMAGGAGVADPSQVTLGSDGGRRGGGGSGAGSLPHPPAAETDEDQLELLRYFHHEGHHLVTLRWDALGTAGPWGTLTADILHCVAHGLARGGGDEAALRADIANSVAAQWSIDSNDLEGKVRAGRSDENWSFYMCVLGDEEHQASIRFDRSLGNLAPDSERPWRIDVTAWLNDATDEGWPTNAEAEELHDIEDAVREAMTGAGGVLAMVVSANARRTWTCYAPEGPGPATALAGRLQSHTGHRVEVEHERDADWECFQALWPNELAWGFIQDQEQLSGLAAAGDNGKVPRTVRHVATFPDPESLARFAVHVRGAGYTGIAEEFEGGEERPHRLTFEQDLAPCPSIFTEAESLRMAASEAGGRYERWSSPVIDEVLEETP